MSKDKRDASTFAQFTQMHLDETGGRYRAIEPTMITGANPIGRYPAASPAHQTQLPDEQPLGFSVDDVPVVNEPHEVERAAEILRERHRQSSSVGVTEGDVGDPLSSPSSLSDARRQRNETDAVVQGEKFEQSASVAPSRPIIDRRRI